MLPATLTVYEEHGVEKFAGGKPARDLIMSANVCSLTSMMASNTTEPQERVELGNALDLLERQEQRELGE